MLELFEGIGSFRWCVWLSDSMYMHFKVVIPMDCEIDVIFTIVFTCVRGTFSRRSSLLDVVI